MNSLKKNNHDPFLLSSNDVEAIQAAATRIAARRRAAASAAAEAAAAAAETARLAEIDQRNQARAQAMIEESRAADAATADQERTAQIESGERRWVPDPPDVQSFSGIGAMRTPRA